MNTTTDLGYWEILITTVSGGIAGVLFFYYAGGIVFSKLEQAFGRKQKARPKKVFTRKNKFIIFIKSKFGLVGLSLITPCMISIPLGSLVAAKYFRDDPKTIPYLLISVVLWGFLLNTFSDFFKTVVGL